MTASNSFNRTFDGYYQGMRMITNHGIDNESHSITVSMHAEHKRNYNSYRDCKANLDKRLKIPK